MFKYIIEINSSIIIKKKKKNSSKNTVPFNLYELIE